MTEDKKNIPMDQTMPEGEPVVGGNEPRNVYAMDQLIEEVEALFPGVEYTVSDRSPRGAAHTVQFPLTEGNAGLRDLLTLIESDERVREVVADTEGVLVTFHPSPAIMDLRDPFDLNAAWDVMDEGSVELSPGSFMSFPGGYDHTVDGPDEVGSL